MLRTGGHWTLVEQAVSSGGTLLVTFTLAHVLSAPEFGAYALCFSGFVFAVGSARAYSGQVLAIRHPFGQNSILPAHFRAAVATPMYLGLLIAAAGAVAALILITISESVAMFALVGGLVIGSMVAQDALRSILISQGRSRSAVVGTATCALLQLLAMTTISRGGGSGSSILAGLGAATAASTIVGCTQLKTLPLVPPRAMRAWFKNVHRTSSRLAFDSLANVGAVQTLFLLLALDLGPGPIGGIRAAQTLFGPMNVIGIAFTSYALPALAASNSAKARRMRAAAAISGAVLLIDLVWTSCVLALPTSLGHVLVGPDVWDQAAPLLIPVAAQLCFVAGLVGPVCVLQASERPNRVLALGALHGASAVALGYVGGLLDAANGALSGYAVASIVVAGISWMVLKASGSESSDRR